MTRLLGPPPARVVDLGCGDGRILIPLLKGGYNVTGVDQDPAALERCRIRARRALRAEPRLICADFCRSVTLPFRAKANAVLCVGNTLMTVLDAGALKRFFRLASRMLRRRGMVILDDFPYECWREITNGNWRTGMSADGSRQLVFVPGEAMFALREGDEVDRRAWKPDLSERLFRLWSISELTEAAATAGMTAPAHLPDCHLLTFVKER